MVANPVLSRPLHPTIEVTATPDNVPQWQTRIGKNLDRNLVYPESFGFGQPMEGVVRIDFHSDENGRPTDLHAIQSTRSRALDRAALVAVTRIQSLYPLPPSVTRDRVMEVQVIFAETDESFARMKNSLAQQQKFAVKAKAQNLMTAELAPLVIASR